MSLEKILRYFLGRGNFRMKGITKKLGEVLQNHQQLVEKIMVLHKPLTMKPPQQSSFFLVIPSHESGFPALTTVKNRTAPYCWHGSEIRRKKKHHFCWIKPIMFISHQKTCLPYQLGQLFLSISTIDIGWSSQHQKTAATVREESWL